MASIFEVFGEQAVQHALGHLEDQVEDLAEEGLYSISNAIGGSSHHVTRDFRNRGPGTDTGPP